MDRVRTIVRWLLAVFYGVAGYFHLAHPRPFLRIMPGWVPNPELVVALTGVAELLGVIGLVQPFSLPLRRAAGWGLALYAVCVWPANFNHMLIDLAQPGHGWGLAYHIPRLTAQPLIIWLALWASRAVDWPWARPARR